MRFCLLAALCGLFLCAVMAACTPPSGDYSLTPPSYPTDMPQPNPTLAPTPSPSPTMVDPESADNE